MMDMFNTVPKKGPIMKPWIKRTLIGALGATVLAGGLAACGSRGHPGDWSPERAAEMRAKVVEKVSHKLDLDQAQKQKLALLSDEISALRKAVRGPGSDPRADFKALIAGEKFDRARAQALLDEKTQAVQGGAPKVTAALADFYDGLNPDQQKQLRGWLDRRHGGWWGRSRG